MIKELIKIKENNNIVSIFCDEDDTSMFLEGYIYAIGRQDFLIKHITPHGLADGYILKKIDSVMHLEISGLVPPPGRRDSLASQASIFAKILWKRNFS